MVDEDEGPDVEGTPSHLIVSPNPSGKRERKLTPKMKSLQEQDEGSDDSKVRAARALDFSRAQESSRAVESSEERKVHLEKDRVRFSAGTAAETAPEKDLRLQKKRQREADRRANETEEERAERLKKARQDYRSKKKQLYIDDEARQDYHSKKKQLYIDDEEMRKLSDELLPQRPSAEHQLKVARAAQEFLLAPNDQICVVCDTFLKPGQKMNHMNVLAIPSSADVVLKRPKDLAPALSQQYNIEVLCIDMAERDRVRSLMLSPRGVGPGSNTDTQVLVCSSCLGSLKDTTNQLTSGVDASKLKPPRWAIANNNFMGVMPASILALEPTAAELAMVAPVFKTAQLVVVRAQKQRAGPGQYRLESHTCSYNLDVEKLIRSLPLKPSDVPFRVLITGPRRANVRLHVGKRFNVRRGVVRMLLTQLKEHNPYYKDITVDEEMLARLPEDAMVEDMIHEDMQEEPAAAADEEKTEEKSKVN